VATYPNVADLLIRADDEEHAADLATDQIMSASYRVRVPRRGPKVYFESEGVYRVIVQYGVDVPQMKRPHA